MILPLSAVTFLDAFGSIEENFCDDEDESNVIFIGDVPSKAERDEKNKENTLYTLELLDVYNTRYIGLIFDCVERDKPDLVTTKGW